MSYKLYECPISNNCCTCEQVNVEECHGVKTQRLMNQQAKREKAEEKSVNEK